MNDAQIQLLFPHLERIRKDFLALHGEFLKVDCSYWDTDESGFPSRLVIVSDLAAEIGGFVAYARLQDRVGALPDYLQISANLAWRG